MHKRQRMALAVFSAVTIMSLLTAMLPEPITAAPSPLAALRSLDETLQQLQTYLRQVRPAGQRAGTEASLTVSIWDEAFDQETIYIRPGDTVTWVNDGGADHAVQGGSPTAVIVTDFQARAQGSAVELRWQTATEADLTGFHLYRAADGGGRKEAVRVTPEMIPAQFPGQPGGASYEYTDDTAPCGHVYRYWLAVHEIGGRIDDAGPAGPAAPCADFQVFLPDVHAPEQGSRAPGAQQQGGGTTQEESWSSGALHPGESYAHTFTTLGTHPYYDPLHITLTGEVVVRPLALTALSPDTAQWGSYIYLSGTGFSADALSNTVVFSLTMPGVAETVPFTASVVDATESELVVIAPLPISGSVLVQVRVAGELSSALPFTATTLTDPTPAEPGSETTGYWNTVITSVVDIQANLEGSPFYLALTQLLSDTVEMSDHEWQAGGLWHIAKESECAGGGPAFHSPASAWYYGQDSTCTYDTGSAHTGLLAMTRAITIPGNVSGAWFSFWQYAGEGLSTGGGDSRFLEISANGGQSWQTLWACLPWSCTEPQGAWYEKEVDISAYISQSVQLRFRFEAGGEDDAYAGWFIDDVQLRTSGENALALSDFFAAVESDFADYREQLLIQEGPEELRLLDAVYSSDAFVDLMSRFDEISFLLATPGETLGGGHIHDTTAADVLESLQAVIDVLSIINTLLDGLRVMLYAAIASLSAACALIPATCPATAGMAALLTTIVKVVEAIKQVVGPITAVLKLFSVRGVPASLRVKNNPWQAVDQMFHDGDGRPIARRGTLYTGADFTVEARMLLKNDGLKRSASQILADLTAFSYAGAAVWIIGQMNIDLLFWVPQMFLSGIHIRSEVLSSDPNCVVPFPKSPNPTVIGIQPTCLADVTIQGHFADTNLADIALTRPFEVLDRPMLESITPDHGRLGTPVVVRARGLETPNSRAHFPAVPAYGAGGILEPESMSFTAITGTLTDTLSGLVFVDALGRESDRVPFTVEPPLLTAFPPSVLLGTSEYLYGEGFSAVVDRNLLHLDTYTVTLDAGRGNGRLAFTLPAADTFLLGERSAWVTTLGVLKSNAVSTTVIAWSPEIDLFGERETLRPALARAANGNVYVAAVERGPNDGTRLLVTSYLSGTVTFTTPAVAGVELGGFSVAPIRPAIAAGLHDNVHVAWVGKLMGRDTVLVSTSTDGGQSFLGPVHVMLPGQPAGALPHDPAIAADGAGVYVAWTYETGDLADLPAVYFARSADGITFGLPQRLSAPGAAAMDPDLAVGPDGTVYAAWAVWHDGIYVAASHDLGMTFGPAIKVSGSVAESWHPAVAAHAACGGGGTRVGVAWQGERILGSSYQGTNVPGRIWFAESSNGGSSFGQPVAVDEGPASLAPDVAYDGDCTAAVAWYVPDSADIVAYPLGCGRFLEDPPATSLPWHGHVHLARKAAAAPGFGLGMALDDQTAGLAYPALAGAGSGGLYAAWQDAARQAYTTTGIVLRTTVEPWPVVSSTVPAFSAPDPTPQQLIVWGEQTSGGLYMAWEDGSSRRRLWHTEFGLYDTGAPFASPPAWSPDGGWIAYPSAGASNTRRGLYVVPPDGEYPLLIAGQCTEAYGFGSLNWSPLSEYPGQNHSRVVTFDWGGFGLNALDLDAALPLAVNWSIDRPVRLSPAWDASAAGSYDFIFLSLVAFSGPHLTFADDTPFITGLQYQYHPAWSPDGLQLVFSSPSNTENTSSLYTAYRNASGLVRLTTGPAGLGDRYPAWSPDGLSILFVRGSGDLYLVPAAGGTADLLLSMTGTVCPPAWSPGMR